MRKLNLSFIFGLHFISLLVGCSSLSIYERELAPKSSFNIEQAHFSSPNEAGWYLIQNDIHTLVFGKKFSDPKETQLISVQMYPVGKFKTHREFLEFVVSERRKNNDLKRFKVLSEHNEFVTYKKLLCLKYQTHSEDHFDKGADSPQFEYFMTKGNVCRYPLEYIGFQFEASQRSMKQEMSSELISKSQEFFDDIQLVEPTIQRLNSIK